MGSAATMQIAASTRKAERQPTPTISGAHDGRQNKRRQSPEPESAMEMARPRLAVNQLAVTRLMSRRVEATAKQPETAKST